MNTFDKDLALEPAAPAHHFDGMRALHLVAVAVMTASVSWSLASFASLWAAVPIALMLACCFARLVRIAATPERWLVRLLAALAAYSVLALTFGLSSGAMYGMLVAESGAVDDYERHRLVAEAQLRAVATDARAAVNALDSLKVLAEQKVALESNTNAADAKDTCPRIPGSRGGSGPVATFWVTEKGLAQSLQAQIQVMVEELEAAIRELPPQRAQRFDEVKARVGQLNLAARRAQALAQGGAVRSVLASLAKNSAGTLIHRGKEVACGAADRQSAYAAASSTLTRLKRAATPAEWAPAIDPSQREAVATRGLLRGFNTALKVMTLGNLGSFGDDARMRRALRDHGYINSETVSMVLAVMAELMVMLTAILAARNGAPAFSFDPVQWLRSRAGGVAGQAGPPPSLHPALLVPLRALVGLLWSRPADESGWAARPAARFDGLAASIGERELNVAAELFPFMVRLQRTDYVIVNEEHGYALAAAQWLEDRALLNGLARDVAWGALNRFARVARQLARTVTSPGKMRMDVYLVHPGLAQAMRLRALEARGCVKGQSRQHGDSGAGVGCGETTHDR